MLKKCYLTKDPFQIVSIECQFRHLSLLEPTVVWANQGLQVQPFKIGPDFIDPSHHQRATGRVPHNLDGWMLNQAQNCQIFDQACEGADLAIVEGVMGLFDGYGAKSEAGSTAEMAKWLRAPVLLVINARSLARSAAALISGFVAFGITSKVY